MIKLIVNKYNLDISKPDERIQYENICNIAQGLGYKKFHVLSDSAYVRELPLKHILQEEILFHDQYNTLGVSVDSTEKEEIIGGYRVHDWYEEYRYASPYKTGYYLTGDIEELNKLKSKFYKCAYCSNSYIGDNPNLFCNKCLGNVYLTENDLYTLIMQPMCGELRKYTDEQMQELKNLYRNAQELANCERKRKKLAYLMEQYRIREQELQEKKFVELTLVENNIPIDNLIRYDSGWVFGWRDPMSQKEVEEIQNKLKNLVDSHECRNETDRWRKDDLLKFTNSVTYKVKV